MDIQLSLANKGKYIITRLPFGYNANMRCMHMGILLNQPIDILHNSNKLHSPTVSIVRGSTIAVGYGLGLKIYVRKINEKAK